ncbi:unnamed protein product [Lymnaea stagnalis]|uniref:G-protein coupled receptors family 1 profile domain-containing protein n=1 Tax=Lymnaea stagnalis TaxID=6523 RepID=A0AAV2IMS8_LYMST
MSANSTENSVFTNTTYLDPYEQMEGQPFDFMKMAAVDWDDVHDGTKLTPRAYTAWNALNILRLSLAAWIVASHVAILVFVLAKQALRSQPKNLLIVNVALTNLLMGGFVVPVKLHFILNPHIVDCDLAIGWTFVAEYFQTSVSLFAVLSLVFERLVYVYTEKRQKNLRPKAEKIGTVVLFLAPWVLACLTLVFTFYGGLIIRHPDQSQCLYKVNDDYFVASQLLSFLPASIGVFVLAPFTGLLDCLRPNRCFYRPLTPKGESMTVTAFVSLVSIFAEAPYCIVRVLMMRMMCNNPFCSKFSEALTITIWIRLCKTAIFPFVWLAYTDIRDAMLCQLNFGYNSDEEDEEEDFDDPDQGQDSQKIPLTPAPSTPSKVPDL